MTNYGYTAYDAYRHSPEEETNRFLHKYEAVAGLSRQRMYHKRKPVRYADWKGDIPFHQDIETEPCVEVQIPQHQFQRLVERESEYTELVRKNQDITHQLWDQRAEEDLRRKHPAVQKAWEKYVLMLQLVKER